MDVSTILDSLNDAQREAVTQPLGSSLILAGVGSGKTRVLVHRIAWLIQVENVSPGSIMAVTFTNKAKVAMRLRIEQVLELPMQNMWVGTFHGLAHRLLQIHWKEAGLPRNFQILDSNDQLRTIKGLMRALDLDEDECPPSKVQWYINGKKDEGLRPQHIEPSYDPLKKIMLQIYFAYENRCRLLGVVDFAELLLRSYELWRENPTLLAHYSERFQQIVVDEFQDTNAVQYAWLRMLAGNKGNLMVVGDDDQSIYGWRGAKIENIRQFTCDFKNAITIRLEKNYRSTGTILKAANTLIANNSDRLGKKLWTDSNDGDLIRVYAGFNEIDESRFIADRIQDAVDGGMAFNDIAVLYRSNAQSRVLENSMLRRGIPYRIYGGQRFFGREEIKNALGYLRLASNQDDDTSLERVINVPVRGLGDKTVQKIRDIARNDGISMWRAAREMVKDKGLTTRVVNAISSFIELIEGLSLSSNNLPLDELVDHMINVTGLMGHYEKEGGEKGCTKMENLEELVSACKQFELDNISDDEAQESLSLDVFLAHAALDAGDTQAGPLTDSVQMMTLHSAKGLEFPLVFMCGMEDGLFPHKRSLDDFDGLNEERRLCYVGITRAMKKLYLTYAETRHLYGKEICNRPSRFLREIPNDLMEEVRLNATISRPVTAGGATEMAGLHLGQRVAHEVFGEGTIVNFSGQGDQVRVQIHFDDEGSKCLMMGYAKLMPL